MILIWNSFSPNLGEVVQTIGIFHLQHQTLAYAGFAFRDIFCQCFAGGTAAESTIDSRQYFGDSSDLLHFLQCHRDIDIELEGVFGDDAVHLEIVNQLFGKSLDLRTGLSIEFFR